MKIVGTHSAGTHSIVAVLKSLKAMANPANVEGMARFGINPKNTLGVSMPALRKVGKEIGKDHQLALGLWDSGVHEARILAGLIDEPSLVTEEQMERWVRDFDSWDVCDQVCMNLFDKTPIAYDKAVAWSHHDGEFVKRAGYALIAVLAVHDKKASDEKLAMFFSHIIRGADDERNFVKKAVNWALRQIGKRNPALCEKALKCARQIAAIDSKAARWIAADAIRELEKKKF
jgi:3-methyladenine DNA glycosylase AlkD